MIHVKRLVVEVPAALTSMNVQAELKKAGKMFSPGAPEGNADLYHFNREIYMHPEVRGALDQLFRSKCAYCETLLSFSQPGDVEQFRPKTRAINLDGVVSVRHYWWLAYEWDNLYIVCAACNRMKATRFPVRAARAKPHETGKRLDKEKCLLLDPCRDNPDEHLIFLETGEVASKTDEGKATIEILGLNREELVRARRETLVALRALAGARVKELSKRSLREEIELNYLLAEEMNAEKPFAALRRQVVSRWLHAAKVTGWDNLFADALEATATRTSADVKSAVSEFKEHTQRQVEYNIEQKGKSQTEVYFSGAKRVERIELKNFKAVEKLELKFPPAPARGEAWLALLGDNAVGKSSILQAVALALMGERHANDLGLDASQYVRRKAAGDAGEVKVFLTNIPEPIRLTFTRGSRRFGVEPKEPKVLLLGYGATRLLPLETKEKGSSEKYVRVRNLFIPTAPLNDAEKWLADVKRLPAPKFEAAVAALKKLLMLDPKTPIRRKGGAVLVTTRDGPVPLRLLSDGFQSIVALCTDIMICLLERWPDLQTAEGIVLIDELEVHLHPRWKIDIVGLLREVFPRVAFIMSTHDPLILKGLAREEIVVLRRNERGRVYASSEAPEVEDLRADQLLTSSLFGLYSTRGRTPECVMRYSRLLGKRRRTHEEEAELLSLKQELGDVMATAETPLGRRAQSIISDSLLARNGPGVSKLLGESTGVARKPARSSTKKSWATKKSEAGRARAPRAASGAGADPVLDAEIRIQLARLLKK